MGSGAEPQPQTLLGRFVRNSVRFYVCFSAFWKLDVRDNNTKSIRKYSLTAVGKVTLHVWTSNWGHRPAAKALNKWDGGRAPRESGLTPSPVLASGVLPPENL